MKKYLLLLGFSAFTYGCQEDPVVLTETYTCELAFDDNSTLNLKADRFLSAMKKIEHIVPGVQVAVRSKDSNIWLGSKGLADIPNESPFQNCTKTMVGSVSKIFTAVLIMQLQEEQILSIDDPIHNWIDREIVNNISNANEVSIRQLLIHSSGIPEYLAVDFQVNAINTSNLRLSPSEKLRYIYGKAAEFSPGEKYQYSNSNYVLLGLIIEKARNMSYDKAINKFINIPLGLLNTQAGIPANSIPAGTARPYLALHDGKFKDVMEYTVAIGGAGDGAVITNMQEVLYFIEAIADETIVSSTSRALMLQNQIDEGHGGSVFYGLGIERIASRHGLKYGHGGFIPPYSSEVYHYPERNVSIAIAFNGYPDSEEDRNKLDYFIYEINDIAFE